MNPIVRIVIVVAALTGAGSIGRATWPAVASNLDALKSWTRTEAVVVAMSGPVEFELGQEPSTRRIVVEVDHFWGLALFRRAPLLVDPSNPSRIKPAGLLQMWLFPSAMLFLILIFLSAALLGARFGTGQGASQRDAAHGRWMFNQSPGALAGGAVLHFHSRQWKIVFGWSMLGVALAVFPMMNRQDNPIGSYYASSAGAAFALTLWGCAWHTKTLEISANDHGIRMTSILGWRDVPWSLVGGLENQSIFTTYYNSNMRMWELPFPGSAVSVYAFLDKRGRTIMSFTPNLQPPAELTRLFELCATHTGVHVQKRSIDLRF